ncbi:MAG: SDR family oxidoreductase [Thermoplasmatota archaeon]
MPSIFRSDLLKDKVALVTGGGTGIGRAIALAYAAHGADVVIASRNKEHLEPTAKEIAGFGRKGLALTMDVRKPEEVAAVVADVEREFGRLDLLVNNAAGNFIVPFEDMSANAWAAVTGIVLQGTFNVTKAATPLLKKGRDASVLAIVANYAWQPAPFVSHSGAAKSAVLSLMRSLSIEWAPLGIRANTLCPGPIETEGAGSRLWAMEGGRDRVIDSVPLRRFGTLEEMGEAALYIAAAKYMTGECLVVDGGQQWTLANWMR